MSAPRQRQSADSGFTLIEILVVIILLGILATVVVFSVRGIGDRGQSTACEEDARIMATAVEAYFAETLTSNIAATGSGPQAREQTLIDAQLIRDFSEYWDIAAEGYLINVEPC